MNLITHSMEYAYHYLSDALLGQVESEENGENETGFSYQFIAVSLLVAATGAYAIKNLIKTTKSKKDTPHELFWEELERKQRPPLPPGPVTIMGKVIAQDLNSLQKEMFSSCSQTSELFFTFLETNEIKPKYVIDLGCGIGANSIPLLKYGIHVIAIDSMNCLLEKYKSCINENQKRFVSFQCGDLTTLESYSHPNILANVVLAIDVFPYIPISSWKSTMEKIVASLKPGGYFFGTIFFKEALINHPAVSIHEMFGANYYKINDLATRLIQYSGLELITCRLRPNGFNCHEFIARKPIEKTP